MARFWGLKRTRNSPSESSTNATPSRGPTPSRPPLATFLTARARFTICRLRRPASFRIRSIRAQAIRDGARRIATPSRIVFVGRFDLHKGADVMIDAFARLAATRPALKLDFVGPDRGIPNPHGGSTGVAEYIERHVSDPAIRRRITIHGQKSPQEANELRRRGFVTVVPSRYETFGYTAVEAMSLGCPLVAANTGGLAEIVQDGETGLLFRSGDPESLASQLSRLLTSPELAARFGQRRAERDPRSLQSTLDCGRNARIIRFSAETLVKPTEQSGRHKAGRQSGLWERVETQTHDDPRSDHVVWLGPLRPAAFHDGCRRGGR